jgi:ankyrin repeat/BTB/POZ domain-containing protein 1
MEQVMYLAEQKEVELNIRDRWDSTPLYYACLCGHLSLVKYLLSKGAICDASTFDGERCVYGALTNEIRKLLLEHKMLTPATMRREAYTEFLRRLFSNDQFKDITFHIHGELVSAHKCILSARSSFLKQQFEERWRGRSEVTLSHRLVSFPAFKGLLEWLYTGQVCRTASDQGVHPLFQVKVEVKYLTEFSKLAKYCKLNLLQEELDKAFRKADEFGKFEGVSQNYPHVQF